MAERGGATPWIAFLVGIVLVAIVAVGYLASTNPTQERAGLEINMPEAPKLNPPDIDLPEAPPAPVTPPTADEPAPAT